MTSAAFRLELIAHASTDATAAARFPRDEPVSDRGRRELARASCPVADAAVAAPEARSAQTAAALGLDAEADAAVREVDYGRWAGLSMDEAATDPNGSESDLVAWLTDADAAPHGGESLTDLLERVATWMQSPARDSGRLVVVTHPSVVRAAVIHAVGAPATAFWRIDVRPLASVLLTSSGGRWAFRAR